MNRDIRAITLDLDDTLWPATPVLVHAESVLLDWLQRHAPRTHVAHTPQLRRAIRDAVLLEFPHRAHDVSFLRRESLRRALVAAGEPEALAEQAFDVFLAARQRVSLYDDVVPTLAHWARRYRVVAVTNGNADVSRVGLGRYFAASVAAHELGIGKPDARIFHEACRRAGVPPGQALHVGDDPHLDVHAALAAGLHAVWLRRPDLARARGDEPAGEAPAVPVCDSLVAVAELLRVDR